MGRELGFWLAVALVAVVANKAFTIFAGSQLGASIPGVPQVASIGQS